MNKEIASVHEPLFHVSKRDVISPQKAALIYVIGVLASLILLALLCTALFGADPITVIVKLFEGNFKNENKVWILLRDMCLLLLVGLALVPSFKMKFWNLGGNGQILMGCLACIACMKFLGGTLPDPVVWIIMILSSLLAGAIWAVIPALFKAFFNTNESLFTLMMNYIAVGVAKICISAWSDSASGGIKPIKNARLPIVGNEYLLTVIVAVVMVVVMYLYLKQSKHGFELSVVGESQNTAKYIGVNVKSVVIRTLIFSGAICGLVGLLLGGAINFTISETTANNMGFTAIMVVWFAKCDPLLMIVSSFGIIFLSKGMPNVQSFYGLTNNAVSDLVIGLVYFIIIACEFFIVYKINLKKKKKEAVVDFVAPAVDTTEQVEKDSATPKKKGIKDLLAKIKSKKGDK